VKKDRQSTALNDPERSVVTCQPCLWDRPATLRHAQAAKRARRSTRLDALLATTVLTSVLAIVSGPTTVRAEDGDPCVMSGQACTFTTVGADGPGASGSGQNGGGGVSADAINHIFTDPNTFANNGTTSPINSASQGGKGQNGASGTSSYNNGQGGNGGVGGAGGAINITVTSPGQGDGAIITGFSSSNASGYTIYSVGGTAGGGALGVANGGEAGASAKGGAGGVITATLGGSFTSAVGKGLDSWSQGGVGGAGATGSHFYSKFGVDGGAGGDGGDINITLAGNLQGQTAGAHVHSIGGTGGKGGDGDTDMSGQGGDGGVGGDGGNVIATLASGAQLFAYGTDVAGLWVQSLGGSGGTGGGGEIGGNGGQGGNAGSATAIVNGAVTTGVGSGSPAVLVQSLGSVGGSGGHAADWSFNPTSGDGNNGGLAGSATVTGSGALIVSGRGNDPTGGGIGAGILAQSIGGAGGIGPDATGPFAIGGSGGTGSNGSTVSVSLTDSSITSYGFNSSGISAQSIGGGGGKGGDADGASTTINMTIGGTGGGGGYAVDSNAAMLGNGFVATTGAHSAGMSIQSIGGGGGDGGSAYSKTESAFYGASLSVGGKGGGGGAGGTVNAARSENNQGRIQTTGSDAFGIFGQSIGGGGGAGGAATAKSVVKSGGDYPGMSLTMATGGTGGGGGAAANLYLQTSGLITTSGAGSIGMLGQSIGGGGGKGGDASATSTASGGGYNFSANISHGGSGGSGGHGGDSELTNNGLIITTGEAASGLLTQSIGGGGGVGGSGDGKSTTSADQGMALTLNLGGSGGSGGQGFQAIATNAGAIFTLGDGAFGMGVQTIGGGGGNAGGGAGSTSGTYSATVNVGGHGSNGGGDTYYNGEASATNVSGTILTFGADAPGILAQSIGGGGGNGGKAGTSSSDQKSTGDGGNGPTASVNAALAAVGLNYASKGVDALGDYNDINLALNTVNALLGNSAAGLGDDATGDALDDTAESGGETQDSNNAKSIAINVGIGGKAGNGGAAGYVNVTNEAGAVVATTGKMSDGIIAQSVGGGGGKGGAASTATSSDYSGSVGVGGSGGKGGNGGEPTVTNAGRVYTMGPLSAGIVAQSIAGGGGIGGASVTSTTDSSSSQLGEDSGDKSISVNVSVGGDGGATGVSGAATVRSSGAIETRGHDSTGIIAQSIAGGGGIVKTLATDLDNAAGSATSSSSKDYAANIKFGGSGGANGASGAVIVSTSTGGAITTKGDNSYGILAQSISGGGGVALGGKPQGTSASNFFGSGKMTGYVNPGIDPNPENNKGVQVSVGDDITTSGQGGVGVFAQSIGGGGGISGDVGWTMQTGTMGRQSSHEGNGGDLQITVAQGATITTTGGNAPGVIAQSVGGGGGWIANKSGAFIGSAGGSGVGGLVNVTIDGVVDAQGPASAGVFAQSVGGAENGGSGSGAAISIQIGSPTNTSAAVNGGNGFGDAAAAISIDHGSQSINTPNTLVNYGTIGSHAGLGGTAIYGNGGFTLVTNNGTINGLIHLGSGNVFGKVVNNGTINPGLTIDLGGGELINNGAVNPGGSGKIGMTTIVGDYVQGPGGALGVDADMQASTADHITVTGKATIDGQVKLQPMTLSNRGPITVLTAMGGLTLASPQVGALPGSGKTTVFTYGAKAVGNELQVTPAADFRAAAAKLGAGQQAVAGHLQEIWDGKSEMGGGFSALATIDDGGIAFSDGLNQLSGQSLGAIAAVRYRSLHAFVGNILNGCPDGFDERTCAWGSATGGQTRQDTTSDVLGYKVTDQTFQVGGWAQLTPSFLVGGSLAYQSSELKGADHTSDVDGSNIMGGVILTYRPGPWELSGALDAGRGSYDTQRFISIGAVQATATASPEMWNAGVHLRAAYRHQAGDWQVKPFADLHADYVHADAYQETGAGPFDLEVKQHSDVALAGSAGVEVRGEMTIGEKDLRVLPFASAAIEILDGDNWAVAARFSDPAGAQGFKASTPLPNVLGKFAVGAEVAGGERWNLRLQYSADVGDTYTAQSGAARLAVSF
jgi:uncharacterized protein YhjY with autotransporter beta-barrel domain